MLRLSGLFVGAGTREGEDKVSQAGNPYRTDDRYKICLSQGDGSLPTFYDCRSREVMDSIKTGVKYGAPVELSASSDRYNKLVITGFAPSVARAS